jgi:putative Mg2+ transporter-C (MgtC) family protein
MEKFLLDHGAQFSILLRLVVAMFLGALIGLDREAAEKPAGLRTHMLVAGAAALLVLLGELLIGELVRNIGDAVIRSDPIRIIAAIITGVSFLGAGTIIRLNRRGSVEGLTTAATLLFASVLGIGVALSQWLVVTGATILVLSVLRLLPAIERLLGGKTQAS